MKLFARSELEFDIDLMNQDLDYVLTQTNWHPENNQIKIGRASCRERV